MGRHRRTPFPIGAPLTLTVFEIFAHRLNHQRDARKDMSPLTQGFQPVIMAFETLHMCANSVSLCNDGVTTQLLHL